jgi:hypothetical protein
MATYFSGWDGVQDMFSDFHENPYLDDKDVIFAYYDQGCYDGTAFVLFLRNGKLYEVHGSHCSCYGLEDSWDPEETTIEALRLRPWGDLTRIFGLSKEQVLSIIRRRLRAVQRS